MVDSDALHRALAEAGEPLTVSEIASRLGEPDTDALDAVLWENPDQFVWQPGHHWALASSKARANSSDGAIREDTRSNMLSGRAPRELRALTLSSGLTIAVNRRPIDSDAFFSVRSAGNTITLTLNSTHELFSDVPMPFEEESGNEIGYKELCEILLSAWALYEDGLPGGSAKRATEDARLLWGRRAIEMLREQDT